jgi:hypothetical protein
MKRILVVKNHFINYHLQYFVFAYAVPSTKILTRRKNIDLALFFLWFATYVCVRHLDVPIIVLTLYRYNLNLIVQFYNNSWALMLTILTTDLTMVYSLYYVIY